jgi:PAS domain S-box-containing protein
MADNISRFGAGIMDDLGQESGRAAPRPRDAATTREARLRAEAAALQAKLETALDLMPGAAVIAEVPSGRLVFANAQVEATLGHPVPLAATVADAYCAVHPDGTPYRLEEYPLARAVAHGEIVRAEEVLCRRRDGRMINLVVNACPVRDATGRSIAAIATWTDVTREKATEIELRRLNDTLERRVEERTVEVRQAVQQLTDSERQLRLMVQAVTDYALFRLDRDGIVSTWNAGAERIKGYRAGEIIGSHFSRFYTEEDRARGVPEHALAVAATEGRFEAEGWRLRRDGTRFWANVVIDVIRDETGEVVGFAKVTRDMSERRAIEEQLRQSQKMEAVGQLTEGVAHDFNNLLAAIVPSLEMARDHIDSDIALKYLGHAAHAAARGAKLTHQLLNFAHKQDFVTRPVDANQLIATLCEMLPRTIGPTVEIVPALDPRLWLALSDPNQLELAILNLAINARDAMSLGGTLTIASANVPAHAAPRELERRDYVVIAVSDTGIGMTEETRVRAFEPFFTTKARDRGTGLGLSIVYGLATRSGGTVTIESTVGKGTTVRVYLPRAEATSPVLDGAPGRNVVDAGPPSRILVVDDDETVRTVTAMILRGFGHDVVVADSGQAALDILAADQGFALLVVDLAMPNMHGAVFVVRARSLVPDVPALFVTGFSDRRWLSDVSPDHLLRKPFSRIDLAARLCQLLPGARRS